MLRAYVESNGVIYVLSDRMFEKVSSFEGT
jgi:hypothetical protein